MSDKTFREQVEEILSFTECEGDGRICSDMTLDKYEERPSCEQCRTDRILAAHDLELERIEKGMTKTVIADVQKEKRNELANPYIEEARKTGIVVGIHKCQAYLLAERAGK